MKTYIVGYDLNKPRQNDDYKKLFEAIKGYPNWWHYLDSTWIIKTDRTSAEIRDDLKRFIDNGDELLVARLAGEAAWQGFSNEAGQWLLDHLSYS